MDRRHKSLLIESILVLAATALAVVGMINLKDYVNRSEAMRAAEQLGAEIMAYRASHGSLPPQSFVDHAKLDVEGAVRLGTLHYRAVWIGLNAPAETIVAYSQKRHPSSFLRDGYVVLLLDGTVQWMPTERFEMLFASQRAPAEPMP